MKYKLKYSPDAGDKLREIKAQIAVSHGKEAAAKAVAKIVGEIAGLKNNPHKGPSVEAILGIPTVYRFLHINQNYVFYRVDNNTILVVDVYNEREDFMGRMFGVKLRSQESIDFWGE